MTLERTPLLLERRGRTRKSTHKALDRMRFHARVSGKKHKKKKKKRRKSPPDSFQVAQRSMDIPPFMPRIGMTVAGPGSFGPVSVGGIMRHS